MTSPTPPLQKYVIHNSLLATRKTTRVTVLLDDALCMRKFIDSRELDKGAEIILQPRVADSTRTIGASTLALIDLEIPDATGPLSDGSWGINCAAAQSHFPQGLQLYIPPWYTMGIDDGYDILLDGREVASGSILNSEEIGARLVTFVPSAELASGPHTLTYVIKRVDRQPETSGELPIFVKLDLPGGVDEDTGTRGHSELKFTLSDDVLDLDSATEGVTVTVLPYPNMAEGDDIRLSYGGQVVRHRVTQAEVDAQANMSITVAPETLRAAGITDEDGLAVMFEIYDRVLNRSSDWSAARRITVTGNPPLLDGPILEQARDGEFDLDTLHGNPATLHIVMRSSSFAPKDSVVARVSGTAADGTLVRHEAATVIVQQLPCIASISLPNAVLRRLEKSPAALSYSRERAGVMTLSCGQFIHIVGQAAGMAAPIARDAKAGVLDPTLVSTVVEIPWDDSMAMGDMITLRWIGTRADLSVYDPELVPHIITGREAINRQPVTFRVVGGHLQTLNGGTLELHFELAQEVDGSIVVWQSAKAQVLRVEKLMAELPAPDVPGSEEGTLDLASVTAEVTVSIPAWLPEMTAGDHVDLVWQHSDGTVLILGKDITGNAVGNDVTFRVALADVAKSIRGTVEVSYVVTPLQGDERTSAPCSLKVIANVIPAISHVMDTDGSEIAEGETHVGINVTVTGTASPDLEVEIFDGILSKGRLSANASGVWSKDLSNLEFTAHSITAKALYGDDLVSPARTFTLSRGAVPTLDTLIDPAGNEVPENGMTAYTAITLTGKAEPGRSVEVLDDDIRQSSVTADITGTWTTTLDDLSPGAHRLRARAVYSDRPESSERRLTVLRAIAVAITGVSDANGAIAEGGSTTDTSVIITGTVTYQ